MKKNLPTNSKSLSFNDYVTRSILLSNSFYIIEINNIESLKTIFFVKESYALIEEVIKKRNIEDIRLIPETQPRTGEYLDIMMFEDQNKKRYIVTVYDSNGLEQDPQIINLYSF